VGLAGRYHGGTDAVINLPRRKSHGCRVRLCAQHGMKIVAQRGNTGMCGAARPHDADRNVVSRLDRMRKIRAVRPLANTITLEACCILQEVQEAAASADRFFPTLPPMSEERSFCAMGRPATSFSESKRSCAAATRRVAGLKGHSQGRSWPT
jgi:ribosomal protein L34